MNLIELENEVATLIKNKDISKAIKITERELSIISKTAFHDILGRNLLHLKNELNLYLSKSYQASQKILHNESKAMYCEMNGFTINYDLWFILSFTFNFTNNLDDTDWIADYDYFHEMALTISGYEDIQQAYKDYMENERWDDQELESASEICALLITLRLQELFKFTFDEFNLLEDWTKIPVFVTSHDYESIYQTL